MDCISIDDPARMNLLGLLLGSIIERNLAVPEKKAMFNGLTADVVVRVGEMMVTLRFNQGKLTIIRGESGHHQAGVSGSMDALMGMALGKGMIMPLLRGLIKIEGNPFLLLRLKSLLAA